MKKDKIIYWIVTSIVSLMGLMAGIMYLTSSLIVEEFKHLGFPDFFRVELAILKITGALVLILPMVPGRIKEWAYAGFAITFISAGIAHVFMEGILSAISPLVSFLLLIISYVYFTNLNKLKALTEKVGGEWKIARYMYNKSK